MTNKIYSLICTRNKELRPITKNLTSYLSRAGVDVKLLINQNSIFEGYSKGFNLLNCDDNDIIILCHDDIIIYNDPIHFRQVLETCNNPGVGFIGIAGTSRLDVEGVWWIDLQKYGANQSKLSGFAIHQGNPPIYSNYGPLGKTVVMDGLFLAASAKTLRAIDLKKPEEFPGKWDFYDLYYTLGAFKAGLSNYTVPLFIEHESHGNLVGRDSWTANREAFIKMNKLPISI